MAIPKETTEAAFPKVIAVGGIKLRPFSLQHVLALAKMKHPLMTPGVKEVTLIDQLTAVAVMGMEADELSELLSNDAGEKEMRKRAYIASAHIPVEQLGILIASLQEQLERGFSTFVPMRREGDGAAVPLAMPSTTGDGPSSP
jgi:hypothetical protein